MNEDIFNTDSLDLILRYGDYTRENFDNAKFHYSFEHIKNLISNREFPCIISKNSDTEHKIIVPLNELGGQFEIVATWHKTFTYEIKVNKHKKTKYNTNIELTDKQYCIEQNCCIHFVGIDELYDNFEVLHELSDLKKRVDKLEIAPKTIIENQRELWIKYIEAQELLIKHLQKPFSCTGKYELSEHRNNNGEISRYKFKVELEAERNEEYRIFEEELKKLDIVETFDDNGTILLKWNDILTGIDTIIERRFKEKLEREKSLGCVLKIRPLTIPKIIQNQINEQLPEIVVFKKSQQNKQIVVSKFSILKFKDEVRIVRGILQKFEFEEEKIEFKIKVDNLDKDKCVLDDTGDVYNIEFSGHFNPQIKKNTVIVPHPKDDIITIYGSEARQYFDLLCKIFGKENVRIDDIWLYYKTEEEIQEKSFNDDFWKELKRDLYETGINHLDTEQFITFNFIEKEDLEQKCEFLRKLNKFEFVKSPLDNDFKFKVKTNLIATKTTKKIFLEKIEKLRGVEFVFDKTKKDDQRRDTIFIGKLSTNESTFNHLVFNIPNYNKEEKKLANAFIKFLENKPDISAVQANLRGDEAKTKWLREAMDKLKDQNQQPEKSNGKAVNPKIRDFIFDSAKAETTYKFDFVPIEDSDEYKGFPKFEILKLNDSQRKSVIRALFAKDLCLLQGPPGTGKTTVIAELIWQHIRQKQTTRLLVTSETNLAVDNALEKLMNEKNANPELVRYITLIKPIRFGKATKFEDEGKKYSIERIEKWLEEEYVKEFEYEDEQLVSADELEEDSVEDNPNFNVIQQWMIRIADRSDFRNPKYRDVLKNWVTELSMPVKETKQLFKEKYFKYANVIGSTCSSTGSPAFAKDYTNIFINSLYENYLKNESYLESIEDIRFLIGSANEHYSDFSEKAHSIIHNIIRKCELQSEQELNSIMNNPTATFIKFLFDYDVNRLLSASNKSSKQYSKLVKRFGFETNQDAEKIKNILFDTVIMDEASKATPPDLLLPLCFGKKSIVIGDHRQLPPMLNEKNFKESLLDLQDKKATELAEEIDREFIETSQFKRLILNPRVSHTIKSTFNVQYRMHPLINDVIKQFYLDDECGGLVCGLDSEQVDSPDLKNPQSRYHGFFHDGFINERTHTIWVNVDEPEMKDGNSHTNDMEVEAVKRVLYYIKHSQGFNDYMKFWDGIKDEEKRKLEKEVGIISFYGKQVTKLRNDIRTTAKNLSIPIRLNTVDKFQGMERNIIIVSTVRSDKLDIGNNIIIPNSDIGFAKAPERLNVALSRARRLLIVVGNKNFFYKFKDREGNPLYKNVIDEIARNGRIIDYKTLNEYAKK
jgi:tRNA A37 threonylcarbamoyladenosine biosynthesis protein TsaE